MSRAERVGAGLGVLIYLGWLAGMILITIELDGWVFRLIGAATVGFIAYRLARFVGVLRSRGAASDG